jgi:hypothetical protein
MTVQKYEYLWWGLILRLGLHITNIWNRMTTDLNTVSIRSLNPKLVSTALGADGQYVNMKKMKQMGAARRAHSTVLLAQQPSSWQRILEGWEVGGRCSCQSPCTKHHRWSHARVRAWSCVVPIMVACALCYFGLGLQNWQNRYSAYKHKEPHLLPAGPYMTPILMQITW